MKIGLITIYQVPNYGSVLQAFATQQLLENLGVDCRMINYIYPNKWHYNHGAKKNKGLRAFMRQIIPSQKVRRLNAFKKANFHLTKRYDSLESLKVEDWSDFDAFIVGSDQVWNPRFLLGDKTFMLSFVPPNKPRFSLASSFATNIIPDELRNKYQQELSLFKAISVREKNGISIINDELGINKSVEVLLDPTLLLSKEEWMQSIPRSSFKKIRPYIVLYLLKYSFDPSPYIYEVLSFFQQAMNADVIALCGYEKSEKACGICMKNAFSSSVSEFIDYIANADLVITNSFHGTAFGLNFGIPLVSVVPNGKADDRQTTLLKSTDAYDCVCQIGSDVANLNPYYDVEKVHKKLTKLRDNNIDWIKKNILS